MEINNKKAKNQQYCIAVTLSYPPNFCVTAKKWNKSTKQNTQQTVFDEKRWSCTIRYIYLQN